jgi:hypothetical protein
MKFSAQTIQILKNFATINQNIMLRPGSELATISTGKNIFATATIAEEIPIEVPIYDLTNLLALLSLTQEPEIDFGEKSLIISKDGATFEYYYSSPDIIVAPPQKKIVVDEHFTFTLAKDDITTILKAAAVMSAPTLSFVTKGGKVFVTVGDPKTKSSNSYKKQIGESEHEFDVQIGVEMIKVIPENYTVALSKKKFIHFRNDERGLKYWLAAGPQSTI